jgi:hypothetical protein
VLVRHFSRNRGSKEAKDEAAVVSFLQAEGLIPVKVSQSGLKSFYQFSFKQNKEGLTQKDIDHLDK